MKRSSSLTTSADPRREIPGTTSARLDRVQAALTSLREEERRLRRLGLEAPLQRCREQRRYWEFLAAVFGSRMRDAGSAAKLGKLSSRSPRGR